MKHITIATYNIRHGHDVRFDWSCLADVIHASGADLVGLQEVDMYTGRTGGADTVTGLANATGLVHTLYIPAMDFDGGQYGTAILSRYPIAASEVHPLDSAHYEPRAFGCVTVTLEDGTPFCFLNTHLSYESIRQQQIQFDQLAAWMEEQTDRSVPTVLTGDFNTENFDAFAPLKALGFALVNHETQTYKTFRTSPLAIDNLVYSPEKLTPIRQGMIDSDCSDHNLLWCRFELI